MMVIDKQTHFSTQMGKKITTAFSRSFPMFIRLKLEMVMTIATRVKNPEKHRAWKPPLWQVNSHGVLQPPLQDPVGRMTLVSHSIAKWGAEGPPTGCSSLTHPLLDPMAQPNLPVSPLLVSAWRRWDGGGKDENEIWVERADW